MDRLNCFRTLSEASNSNHKFSKDIYLQLKAKELQTNLVVSPFSLASVLQLAMAGAEGNTRNEIREGLKLPNDYNSSYLDHYMKSNLDKSFILSSTSRIFIEKSVNVFESFKQGNKIAEVHFNGNLSQAVREINEWVSNETNEKITGIVDKGKT